MEENATLSPFTSVKIWPAFGVAAYWTALWALQGFRADHVWVGLLFLGLAYGGRIGRKVSPFLFPLVLAGAIYDSQRFYSDYLRGRVRVVEPYNFDKTFFGIRTAAGQILTPNEWWQLHTHWALDLVTGFYYLTFVAIYVGVSAWFFFRLSRRGTPKVPALEVARQAPRMMWSFFWVNMLGYSTYYWFPAAPPWYVAEHGLGPAKMDTLASAAGCVRFDQLLGTQFFTGMYGRSADVFGAVPSLHVAYPLLAALFAFRFGALRVFCLSFYLIMCFSAVYLNHHYLLDILWGSTYAVLIYSVIHWMADRGWILKTPA